MRFSPFLLLSLLPTLMVGCKGPAERPNFEGRTKGQQAATPGTPGTDPSGPTKGESGTGGAPIAPDDIQISTPKRLWRLTPEQLVNATDSLFNRETSISKRISSDSPAQSGFGNEADVLKMDTAYIANLEEAVSETAREFLADIEKQLDCGKITAIAQDAKCLPAFLDKFGSKAFRRSITAEEKASYSLLYTKLEKSVGATEAFHAVVEAILRSPNFLFRSEVGSGIAGDSRLPPDELASALAFALTNSPPDDALLAAAKDGSLSKDEVYLSHAKRLLASPAFAKGFKQFVARWSGLRWLPEAQKDATLFPDYKAGTVTAMLSETDAFIDHVLTKENGSYDAFLTSRKTTITSPLAGIYGVEAFTGSKALDLDELERSGFFTLPGVIAVNSSASATSPMRRAMLLLNKVMCIPTSQVNVADPNERMDSNPNQTERERFTAIGMEPTCSGCHDKMNPMGFSMELYDPIGKIRTMEKGKPIDSSSKVFGSIDSEVEFKNLPDLLSKVSKKQDVTSCFVKNAFRYLHGRFETKVDAPQISGTLKDFQDANFDMKSVFLSLVTSESFKSRKDAPQ